jgi:hypothetical protein
MLYGTLGLLWITGMAWLPGKEGTPARILCMKIHGAAAMAFLIVFGALLFQHVPDGWGEKRQRATGSGLVVFCSFLILTGWGLYYFGNESLRRITSLAHSLIGGLVPAFLLVHILLGRRHR